MKLGLPTIGLPTIGVPAPIRSAQRWLGDRDGRHARRASVVRDRAHIEVRGALDPHHHALRPSVKAALERIEGVQWAEVDAIVGRAVVLFDPEAVDLDELIDAIEDVEEAHGTAGQRFPHHQPDHPDDLQPVQRRAVAIAADTVGLGIVAAGQALHLARIPSVIPGLVTLADSQPRIRQLLERQLGPPTTDLVVGGANAVAQTLGQGSIGLMVDIAQHSTRIGEQLARRSAWKRLEPELIEGPHSVRHDPVERPARVKALPNGPIERYTDAAAIGSIAAIGATLGLTGNPRRAADFVLTGVPKAATLGRETFAATLSMVLSAHDVVVMDPRALRRLDRVTIAAIDARLVRTGRWRVEAVEPIGDEVTATAAQLQARTLLVDDDPAAERQDGSWRIAPWAPDDRAPRGTDAAARRLRKGGRRVVALWHGDRPAALVALAEEPSPMARGFCEAAAETGLAVVLAGGTDALAESLGDVTRWPATRVDQEIRDAQARDQVVMYASGSAHRGLLAADVAIGVRTPGHRAPTGADVIIREGLGQGRLLLAATVAARAVSKRSALLAVAGASAGGGWALASAGRQAAPRIMLAINASAVVAMANGAIAAVGVAATPMPVERLAPRWHELATDQILGLTGTSEAGLTADEQARRRRDETARPPVAEVSELQAFWEELANPLTPILVAGAALSAAVGSATDAALVLGVVGVNAGVGAVQRLRTERALSELEGGEVAAVRVVSSGQLGLVPADHLVVGDVIRLSAGEGVPADCRLLTADAVEVDESALTGESLLVAKHTQPTPGAATGERASMVFEGTVVASGEITAVVVAVGIDTEVGRSQLAAAEPPPSGVERRLQALTDVTIPVTIGAGVLATGMGFLFRRPMREAVGAGVSLTVAAVPEGLPAVATLAQVASARRLARRNALVRNPRAIEALGRIEQVCFDKTGTLTEGRLALVLVSDGEATARPGDASGPLLDVLRTARRATPAVDEHGTLPHATDRSVHDAAEAAGVGDDGPGWTRLGELPFESRRALHAGLGRQGRNRRIVVKGAPEAILPLAASWQRAGATTTLDPEQRRILDDHIHQLGRQGLRVLAVASAPVGSDAALGDVDDLPPLVLEGFIAIADPVRPTTADAIGLLQGAGVHLAMITGDHPSTAEAIAAELGMLNGSTTLTGPDLDLLDDDELDRVIGDTAVFARVSPLQKVRIVRSYQRIGRPVAMTGDGANDAAAIRLADAGIALGGRGSDAARASADVVVTDDRIETIVDAIVEGRAMWESVRGAVAILIGGNLGEMGFTLAGTSVGGQAPLNPRQLLLVNLLTDMAPALAIALREPDVSPEALLRAGPDSSLGGALLRDIAVRAGTTASGATAAWVIARLSGTPTRARTVGLAALVGTQLAQTIVAGGTRPTVLAATGVSVGVLVFVIQTPGVSQFFGCRPLGPVAWSIAAGSAAGATACSIVVPWAGEHAGRTITAIGHRAADLLPSPDPSTIEGTVA